MHSIGHHADKFAIDRVLRREDNFLESAGLRHSREDVCEAIAGSFNVSSLDHYRRATKIPAWMLSKTTDSR